MGAKAPSQALPPTPLKNFKKPLFSQNLAKMRPQSGSAPPSTPRKNMAPPLNRMTGLRYILDFFFMNLQNEVINRYC